MRSSVGHRLVSKTMSEGSIPSGRAKRYNSFSVCHYKTTKLGSPDTSLE